MINPLPRFAESPLWQRQRQYFEHMGIEAWRQAIVPQYITTNPFLARAYSNIVLGFLRDAHLQTDEPLYIVEFGAGTGRFAFHFLRKFLPLLELSPFAGLDVRYILTDFAPKTLDSWRENPTLNALMTQGILDYAHFDMENPQELTLLHSGQVLNPATLVNPLVLIANYVFDSIPQDLFWVEDGELEEYRVDVAWVDVTEEKHWAAGADLTFATVPVTPDYYVIPELNLILQDYQETLNQTVVSIPSRALEALHYFGNKSHQARLVLCGDKGITRFEDLAQQFIPALASHGSFSLPVNFDAIKRYTELRHGHVIQPNQRHTNLHVMALIWNDTIRETQLAFHQAMELGGPDEFFLLKCALENHYDTLNFDQLLAWLRWSGWDSKIFLGCFERLSAFIPQCTPDEREALHNTITQIWQNYLALNEDEDVAACLGRLLYGMKLYSEAVVYFQHSLDQYGATCNILYNMGVCYYALNNSSQALHAFQQALALDAEFAPAQEMLDVLEKE